MGAQGGAMPKRWEQRCVLLVRTLSSSRLSCPQILVSQHSGVEAHSHSYSQSSSSLNEEPKASGAAAHISTPVLEVRHRLPHGDR